MTIRNYIGAAMVASPFVAMAAFICAIAGPWVALVGLAACVAFLLFVFAGVSLLTGDRL